MNLPISNMANKMKLDIRSCWLFVLMTIALHSRSHFKLLVGKCEKWTHLTVIKIYPSELIVKPKLLHIPSSLLRRNPENLQQKIAKQKSKYVLFIFQTPFNLMNTSSHFTILRSSSLIGYFILRMISLLLGLANFYTRF